MEPENTNIKIKIKYGKKYPLAEFNVFYSNGLIICLSMKIGKDWIHPESRKNYFRTNYKSIKKEFHVIHGETA